MVYLHRKVTGFHYRPAITITLNISSCLQCNNLHLQIYLQQFPKFIIISTFWHKLITYLHVRVYQLDNVGYGGVFVSRSATANTLQQVVVAQLSSVPLRIERRKQVTVVGRARGSAAPAAASVPRASREGW